ncbi:MAG: acetate--CoA ligase family protein [Candidatus Rokubacteria bacterium]|nr:acetate--CoA ligase family protein [Candidatus Rokubacteria bacterium]
MTDLRALFSPRAVAVLGVSRDPAKLGHRLLKNLSDYGYEGAIYPVHPSGEPILERPTLPQIADLPEGLDLALVSLPAPAVVQAVKALARRRVRLAVVLSSGFGEVDARGRAAQDELLAAARESGMRLVGPNCMGVYSSHSRLNGTYFWELPTQRGEISVVSQSGAYGGLILRHLASVGLGVAKFVSIGNQVDLGVEELFGYLADDSETGLIACFLEGVRDGRRFVEAAQRASGIKPVVVLKGGRTRAGDQAARSHTGALAGTYAIYGAAFRRAGIVASEETEEFLDAIEALARSRRSFPRGKGVAIVTVSGGPSVVGADAAETLGLEVPALPEPCRAELRRMLPPFAATRNPVDLTPQVTPAAIAAVARAVLAQGAISGALAINVGLDLPEFAQGLVRAAHEYGKPLVAFTADAPEVTRWFTASGVPVLPTPERAVRAYRALYVAGQAREGCVRANAMLPLAPDLQALLSTREGVLSYTLARRILEATGIPFCRERWADSAAEAIEVAKALGFPVVIKAMRDELLHKSEAGAVRVNLRDPQDVADACQTLAARLGPVQYLIQDQVEPGVELLIGGRRDPVFGPVVAVGTGGLLAEAVQDVSIALAPLGSAEAREILGQGLRARLLQGSRGMPGCDAEPLVRILVAVGQLLAAYPRIAELDLNPVIARGDRAVGVDALLILA